MRSVTHVTVKKMDSCFTKLRGLVGIILVIISSSAGAIENSHGEQLIQQLNEMIAGKNHERYQRQVEQVPNFRSHSRLIFDIENSIFRFEYDQEALNHPALMIPDALLFWSIGNYGPTPIAGITPKPKSLLSDKLNAAKGTITTAFALTEVWREARLGDSAAKLRLLRWRLATIEGLVVSDAFEQEYPGTREALSMNEKSLNAQIAALTPQIGAFYEPTIDKEHLKKLVARNDRAGVATLYRSQIPWKTLPPLQVKLWREWLSAIESPSKDAIWLFRGFQDEQAYSAAVAQDKDRVGFVAQKLYPTLTQSDVDRTALNAESPEVVYKLSDAMESHSNASSGGSIFMSMTSDFEVAAGFVSGNGRFPGTVGEMIAVKMDRRRAIANFFSSFHREREYLAPLIIFPDEVIRLQKDFVVERDEVGFLEAIKALGYKESSKDEIAKSFYRDGHESLRHYLRTSCEDLFAKKGQ